LRLNSAGPEMLVNNMGAIALKSKEDYDLLIPSFATGHGERTRRPVVPGSPESDAGNPACVAPKGIH
jgi:hypothetical protein